jgi:hypothetical protein
VVVAVAEIVFLVRMVVLEVVPVMVSVMDILDKVMPEV